MKKITLLFLILLVFISCDLSGAKSSDGATGADVNPKELLQNLPVTLDEFVTSDKTSRTLLPVDNNSLEKVIRYEDISLAIPDVFMTVLKNDVSTSQNFEMDKLVSTEGVEYSQVTRDLVNTVGMEPEYIFNDLGKVKVSYSGDTVEIFWNCTLVNGDGIQSSEPVNLYIIGTYKNNKYENLNLYIKYFFGAPQTHVEKIYKDGEKYNKQITEFEYLEDTPYISSESFEIIDDDTRISVYLGRNGMNPDSLETANSLIKNYRDISVITSDFYSDYHKNNSDKYYREECSIYDSNKNLVLSQSFDKETGKYFNKIPALYLNKTIYADESNYYLDDNGKHKLEKFEFESLDTSEPGNKRHHVYIPCFVVESDVAEVVDAVSDEDFSYKELSNNAIKKLSSLNNNISDDDFIDNDTVESMKSKIEEWKNYLTENE